jgi:hypothetical protein
VIEELAERVELRLVYVVSRTAYQPGLRLPARHRSRSVELDE